MAVLKSSASRRGGAGIALDLGDLRREAEGIVRDAEARAATILEEAHRERARILEGAAEEGRAAGHAEGLEEGRAAGRGEGRAAAMAEMKAELERLASGWAAALDDFAGRRERVDSETRRDVVGLGAAIATRVIKRSVELDPSIVVDQVRASVELVMRRTRLVVAVHPEDRALVEEALPSLAARCGDGGHVELTDDASLARGSCVVRTEHGEIDAEVDRQIERMVEAMLPREEWGGDGGAAEDADGADGAEERGGGAS